ncbi:DNA replication licencing factor MCM2, putative [Cryptosporidium muris RN66]|uniref:DNA replication licensing factor MCM2 n=1 Tax=Cryptosporidium muris (strain RN66) TaxID=441375 RepID=B6ADZ4_CRYMR|nr:DNA replication licencing factor MCM2, putative [Cryptosporidium muris RN66]EEA06435.1 DNA replication licencing factor MCM2, putative [Cryptosporidium muris RN66]|eukprot:XP_002140784.1 DNA replication licencing factor MCM2 [Cryptosporidium muris RN66]
MGFSRKDRGRTGIDPHKSDEDAERTGRDISSILMTEETSNYSEAEEVPIDEIAYEEEINESEEEVGEDLYADNFLDDYQPDPELDRYDPDILDDTNYEDDPEARRRAEIALDRRDMAERGELMTGTEHRFGITSYLVDEELGDTSKDIEKRRKRREMFRAMADEAMRGTGSFDINELIQELPLAEQSEWSEHIENLICRLFKIFIQEFKLSAWHKATPNDENIKLMEKNKFLFDELYYMKKIEEMVQEEKTSLHIDVRHIFTFCYKLWDYLNIYPTPIIECFDRCILEIISSLFPNLYNNKTITTRLIGLDYIDELRDLRVEWLNQLIRVSGIITRRTNVLTKYKTVYMECVKCGCDTLGPYEDFGTNNSSFGNGENSSLRSVGKCTDCQSRGPFIINREKTIYENYQKLVIQESPGSVPAGRIPRSREIIVTGDLVDSVCPGEEVILTGIYRTFKDRQLNIKTGFPILGTQIFCNNIEKKHDPLQQDELTDEDFKKIRELSKDPDIKEKIISSIAPSIFGHHHIKTAIACSLFSGIRKQVPGKHHHIRGDINILIVGDPGLAKSQFLKYVEKSFDRTIYTSGKGASAVGLTASVRRDPISGEWTLEGGALVLADEGICLIDEFDKMSDKDRVSIHEAMEQQSISISKAGIVTTLRARCSVIAAANPIFGRYDSCLTFKDNVDLTDPIISRFDVLAVLKDEVHPMKDELLANFVVQSHMNSQGIYNNTTDEFNVTNLDDESQQYQHIQQIDQKLLCKYIRYARRYCKPQIRNVDKEKITTFYARIRQEAIQTGGISMTVRHIESIIRLAEAQAKMRLSPIVTNKDIDGAIGIVLESFIQSQKYAVAQRLSKTFSRYKALSSGFVDILENLLLQLFADKINKIQLRQWSDDNLGMMLDEVDNAMVYLDEFLVCAEKMKLSHNVTFSYIKSSAFGKLFLVSDHVDNNGNNIKVITKKHYNDKYSQSQISMQGD